MVLTAFFPPGAAVGYFLFLVEPGPSFITSSSPVYTLLLVVERGNCNTERTFLWSVYGLHHGAIMSASVCLLENSEMYPWINNKRSGT